MMYFNDLQTKQNWNCHNEILTRTAWSLIYINELPISVDWVQNQNYIKDNQCTHYKYSQISHFYTYFLIVFIFIWSNIIVKKHNAKKHTVNKSNEHIYNFNLSIEDSLNLITYRVKYEIASFGKKPNNH